MLHVINQFPIESKSLAKANNGDTLLFTENAVYAVKQKQSKNEVTRKRYAHVNLCVRQNDLLSRNISNNELFRGVTVIDDIDYQSIIGQEMAIRSWN